MRTLIVGGGLGGMALAAFLQQRGLDCSLIERNADFANHHGFALGIWSNGLAVLRQLGVRLAAADVGTPILQYRVCARRGELACFSLAGFQRRYGMPYTQLPRQLLHEMLAQRVDPARLRSGVRFIAATGEGSCLRVRMAAGQREITEAFDAVVGADGVHSAVRQCFFGSNLQRYSGWRAWYAWIDQNLIPANTAIEHVFPGRCTAMFDGEDRALAVFFAPQPPGSEPENMEQLQSLFAGRSSLIDRALQSIHPAELLGVDLATVQLARWTSAQVALLGDAAHAFEPHNGLGASMAMEDAAVLADELASAADGKKPLAAALAGYQNRRMPRVAIARRISHRIRRFAFVRSALWRHLADAAIPFLPQALFERDYHQLLG